MKQIKNNFMSVNLGENKNPNIDLIAIDCGYSSVKSISDNNGIIFPSFAKKVNKDFKSYAEADSEDIIIEFTKPDFGKYVVGSLAIDLMEQSDILSTSNKDKYSRYRYESPEYKILNITAVCANLFKKNKKDSLIIDSDRKIVLQTGLPSSYAKKDEELVKDALWGKYEGSIQIGNNKAREFSFNIRKDDIYVMEQPQGTLCSVMYDIPTQNAKNFIKENILVYDVGFGTEDIFSLKHGYTDKSISYVDTGTESVLEAVCEDIYNETGKDIKVVEIQKYLDSHIISFFDRRSRKVVQYDFKKSLDENTEKITLKSLERLMRETDDLSDYSYLIITGGSNYLRKSIIKNFFKDFPIKIIFAPLQKDERLLTFANVLGFYNFRLGAINKGFN